MDAETARLRLAGARIGHLATVTRAGAPHVVPCCFVLEGDHILTAVDAKPKSTRALRRLENVEANPAASLLVDHYSEDWRGLWWVRADGQAQVVTDPEQVGEAAQALTRKYPQYETISIDGPLIVIDVESWRWWP